MKDLYYEYWEFGGFFGRAQVVWVGLGMLCFVVVGIALLLEQMEKGRKATDIAWGAFAFTLFIGPFIVVFGPLGLFAVGWMAARSYVRGLIARPPE